MSRSDCSGRAAEGTPQAASGEPAPGDDAKFVEDIANAALALADRARAGGFPTLGFLLESAALEAGAEAAARRWPSDAAEPQ